MTWFGVWMEIKLVFVSRGIEIEVFSEGGSKMT